MGPSFATGSSTSVCTSLKVVARISVGCHGTAEQSAKVWSSGKLFRQKCAAGLKLGNRGCHLHASNVQDISCGAELACERTSVRGGAVPVRRVAKPLAKHRSSTGHGERVKGHKPVGARSYSVPHLNYKIELRVVIQIPLRNGANSVTVIFQSKR